MIAPKTESRDIVMRWLGSYNLANMAVVSPRLDSIIVKASIIQVEKLLNAEYSQFGMLIGFLQYLSPM